MINWALYPNFSEAEFKCSHTGLCVMRADFLDKLQKIRADYGKPMKITSGYRHPSHPIEAKKGHSRGEHTTGWCADVYCDNGADRFALVTLALKHGITRIGVAKTFLHLGIGGLGLPDDVIWEYA